MINHTLDILEQHDVEATFFATHQTQVLDRIHHNGSMECGIHPNFNKALSAQENKSYSAVIDELLSIVPNAVSERAHCLTQNTLISFELSRRGLKYDLNTYIPLSAGMPLRPYRTFSGLLSIPFFFEDDIYFFYQNEKSPVKEYFTADGIKVFNFHPIHIFINTGSLDLYEHAKPFLHETPKLREMINKGFGAKDFLLSVINYGKKYNYRFKTINQI